MNDKCASEVDTSLYNDLRKGLIVGRWKSGERLVPQRLKQELSCTNSVLRDALMRLAGEGLIISEKNLGFRAVSHTERAFRDAAHLRLTLELEAVKQALSHGDFDWELDLSAAFQKLAHVEKQMCVTLDVAKFVDHWTLLDWEFHSTLLRGCDSDIMMRAYRLAFDTFRMYSVAAFPDFGFRWEETTNEHRAIYEAAVSRNIPACLAAVERHVSVYYSSDQADDAISNEGQSALTSGVQNKGAS